MPRNKYDEQHMRENKRRFQRCANAVPDDDCVRIKWTCAECATENDRRIPRFDIVHGVVWATCRGCGASEPTGLSDEQLEWVFGDKGTKLKGSPKNANG